MRHEGRLRALDRAARVQVRAHVLELVVRAVGAERICSSAAGGVPPSRSATRTGTWPLKRAHSASPVVDAGDRPWTGRTRRGSIIPAQYSRSKARGANHSHRMLTPRCARAAARLAGRRQKGRLRPRHGGRRMNSHCFAPSCARANFPTRGGGGNRGKHLSEAKPSRPDTGGDFKGERKHSVSLTDHRLWSCLTGGNNKHKKGEQCQFIG